MRFLLAMAFLASCISAQTPQTFEIRGTVSEPGLGPIVGAPIYIRLVTVLPSSPPTVGPIPDAYTDGRGQFLFKTQKAGTYQIEPIVSGYSRGSASAKLDENRSRVEVSVSLFRLAQITGRVVDPETREPVPDVPVVAVQRAEQPGGAYSWEPRNYQMPINLTLPPEIAAEMAQQILRTAGKSDKNGIFTIPGLLPGEYAVWVRRTGAATRPIISTELSTEDPEATDASTISLFWPEGVRNQNVPPFSLGSGGLLNIGTIPLKKATLYRAYISIPQGACPQGESLRLSVFAPGEGENSKVVPCGTDVFLRGLEPGTYWLYAVADWQGERDNVEAAFWGTTSFEVTDKNTKALLSLERGLIIDGRLTAARGVESLPAQIGIVMKPAELAPGASPPVEQFIEWGENGRFRMAISPRAQTMQVMGTRDNLFVKELRYNGSPLPNLTIPINTGTAAQNLEVVLDKRAPQPPANGAHELLTR